MNRKFCLNLLFDEFDWDCLFFQKMWLRGLFTLLNDESENWLVHGSDVFTVDDEGILGILCRA